jgi:exosortase/archaeosortase family protein
MGRFSLEIAKNCDAAEANILLAAALLAFPARLSRRLLALAIGVGLLAAMNVVRIFSLYFVGLHAKRWFEFAHLELWPLILIGFAAFEFLLLARWMHDSPETP